MQEQYIKPLRELNYANLSHEQETKLKELEKQFNTNLGKEVYFMVMEK